MAHTAHTTHQNHLFLIAILCSIALHGSGIAFLPGYLNHTPPPDAPLTVELLKQEPPPPPPVKMPEPPKPEPQKPKLAPPSKPLPATPTPKPFTPPPQPVTPPVAAPIATPPPVAAADPQPVIALPQKPSEPTPPVTAPTPQPPAAQEPVAEDLGAIKAGYGKLLSGEFAKHKKYPQVARMRGWQGSVQIRLQVDADGNASNPSIEQSSGREILDNQALETVRNSLPLPLPPSALRGKAFSIVVPVVFRLESPS